MTEGGGKLFEMRVAGDKGSSQVDGWFIEVQRGTGGPGCPVEQREQEN